MIVVTGADGFLGSVVSQHLSGDDYIPVTHRTDLCDRKAVESIFFRPYVDAVIHCAASGITGVSSGVTLDPSAAVTDNLVMSARLIEAAAKAKVKRFVFLSSSTVYPAFTRPMLENDALAPDSFYEGVAGVKVYVEQKLLPFYWKKYGMKYVILRPTAIYGPGDRSSHVIPDLIRKALASKTKTVPVNGSKTTVRDFVYVDDVAEACVLAATFNGEANPIFNIGSGERIDLGDVGRVIADATGCDRVTYSPENASAIPYRQVSISAAKSVLGWEPKTGFVDGIRRTVEWMR